ncbi:hypothetical protein CONCODRAFT_12961, partial [Conidiobolus coronatus NRRL 28638]
MKSILFYSSFVLNLSALSVKSSIDLYIVGDSLSDNANTWTLTNAKRPDARVYPAHKYTNGLVWNEYLSEQYPNINVKNYAAGGSTTDGDVLRLDTDVPSLKEQALQISSELAKPERKKCGVHPKNRKLAVVWGGSNDF